MNDDKEQKESKEFGGSLFGHLAKRVYSVPWLFLMWHVEIDRGVPHPPNGQGFSCTETAKRTVTRGLSKRKELIVEKLNVLVQQIFEF